MINEKIVSKENIAKYGVKQNCPIRSQFALNTEKIAGLARRCEAVVFLCFSLKGLYYCSSCELFCSIYKILF